MAVALVGLGGESLSLLERYPCNKRGVMPLRFRKSVSIAGVRLNFGKTGLTSVSSGIPGFRITSGRYGTRVTVGFPGTGISYSEKLGDRSQAQPVAQNALLLPGEQAIQTVTAADLGEISSQELIEQINKRANRFPLVVVPVTFFVLLFSVVWAISDIGVILFAVACAVATWWAYKKDIERRITHLHYEMDSDQMGTHGAIRQSIEHLAQSHMVWHTISQQSADWKHHGGASTLIRRHRTSVNSAKLPKVTTNIEVPSIAGNGIKLFFLPDHMLVWQGSKYGSVSYQTLSVKVGETRFVESESVPGDAVVVDTTWLHPNRNGGPDRRFSDNRQLPVVQYGLVEFSIPAGVIACFQVSSRTIASDFGKQWTPLISSVAVSIDESWRSELADTPTPADYARRVLEIFDVTTIEELGAYSWPFTTVEEASAQLDRLNSQGSLLDMLKQEIGFVVERFRVTHVPQSVIDQYTAIIEATDEYIGQVARVREVVENCLRNIYDARDRGMEAGEALS
jgi:hypothetical protein